MSLKDPFGTVADGNSKNINNGRTVRSYSGHFDARTIYPCDVILVKVNLNPSFLDNIVVPHFSHMLVLPF